MRACTNWRGAREMRRRHRTNPPARPGIMKAISDNVHRESTLHTDGAQYYKFPRGVKKHETVNHSIGEYARKTEIGVVHVNSVEGFFSVFKRGMIGTYQHVSADHLARYTAEFNFHQN